MPYIDLSFKAVADAKRAIVVDLSQVNFLTSRAIRMLVFGARAVTNKGGKLRVCSTPNEWVNFSVLKWGAVDRTISIPVMFRIALRLSGGGCGRF